VGRPAPGLVWNFFPDSVTFYARIWFYNKTNIMEPRIAIYPDLSKEYVSVLMKFGAYLHHSSLDKKLLDLVAYRVSQINGCAFCLDMHHKEAIGHGETELRLHSLPAWRECPYYTAQERAVLAYVEAVNAGPVPDEVYDPLVDFFTKQEMADLTLAIAGTGLWNKLNKAFLTVPGNYVVGQFA
jgi:AhpD family alkylhydroperoxidase